MTISTHVISASVTGVSFTYPTVPAVTIYSYGFESGADSWSAGNGNSAIYTGNYFGSPHSGTHVASVYSPSLAANAQIQIKRIFTGLTVGLSYTAASWFNWESGATGTNAKVGVTGLSYGTAINPAGGTWAQVSYTFTATATSHTVLLEFTTDASGSANPAFDDFTLTQNAYATTVPNYPLDIISSTITLDEYAVPYIQGQLVCTVPSISYLDSIDPRLGLRISVELNQTGGLTTSRTLDLTLTDRSLDFNEWTMTLSVASDEALLDNYALVATSADNTANGITVESAVTYALGKIGASLSGSPADFTLPNDSPIIQRTNLVADPQPALATSGGWTLGTGSSAPTLSATAGSPISTSTTALRTTNAAGTVSQYVGGANTSATWIASTVGQQYTASVYIKSSVARSATINLRFFNASAGTISTATSTAVTTSTTAWTRLTITATAPALTVGMGVFVSTASNTVSTFHYYAGAQVETGATATTYLDGDLPSTSTLDYVWSGTAHASASYEDYMNSQATTWNPGTSAYDFVAPLVQTGALRLWCDESRNWHLDLSSATSSTFISMASGSNVTQANETVSLTSGEWYSAVVVQYNWTDSTGLSHIEYDSAGTPTNGRTLLQVYDNTPYPGPGAAAAILVRASNKGRVFNVTGIPNYTVTPTGSLLVSLPNDDVQSGITSAVTFTFSAEGDADMSITSRGLVTIPAHTWIGITETSWSTVAETTWATLT